MTLKCHEQTFMITRGLEKIGKNVIFYRNFCETILQWENLRNLLLLGISVKSNWAILWSKKLSFWPFGVFRCGILLQKSKFSFRATRITVLISRKIWVAVNCFHFNTVYFRHTIHANFVVWFQKFSWNQNPPLIKRFFLYTTLDSLPPGAHRVCRENVSAKID